VMQLAKQATKSPGAIISVLADDPAFPPDVEAWCRQTGGKLLSLEQEGSAFHATIQPQNPGRGS
jgi:TusA-related sulfurtransferase